MKKVLIRMNSTQSKVSDLMIVGWLVVLGLALFDKVGWIWLVGYSIVGFIAFIVFSLLQIRKGNFKEIKTPQ